MQTPSIRTKDSGARDTQVFSYRFNGDLSFGVPSAVVSSASCTTAPPSTSEEEIPDRLRPRQQAGLPTPSDGTPQRRRTLRPLR